MTKQVQVTSLLLRFSKDAKDLLLRNKLSVFGRLLSMKIPFCGLLLRGAKYNTKYLLRPSSDQRDVVRSWLS